MLHRVFMVYDPRQFMAGLHIFLFGLSFMIHFTLLSTDRYNWMEGPDRASSAPQAQNSALPQ